MYTVRLFCVKFVKWCWLKENSSDKGCFITKKKSVLATLPPFIQHSSIDLDIIFKKREKILNFIKNVIQLFHNMCTTCKHKKNINYICI